MDRGGIPRQKNKGACPLRKKLAENEEPQLQNKRGRLTTLHDSSEAENEEPQLQNKRGRLTTLHVSNEAENGEPQLQNKRGTNFICEEAHYLENENEQVFTFTIDCVDGRLRDVFRNGVRGNAT